MIFLSMLVASNAAAESVDYLCKVKGSFYDFDARGNINETISMSLDINNSGLSFIKLNGSENTEMSLHFGQVGKSFSGPVSWSNFSSGKTIDVINSNSIKGGDSQTRFTFNRLTKVVSANYDYFSSSGHLVHKNFSGTCVIP